MDSPIGLDKLDAVAPSTLLSEEQGYDGLRDRRKGKTSQRRVALETCESLNTLESTRHDLGTSPLWFCVALDRQLELGDECVVGRLYFGGVG